jgi:ATP-binding cassette subfamily F protein uup
VPQFAEDATVETAIHEVLHDPYDWQEMARAQEIMAKLSLDPSQHIGAMSGGWKKRVALARELARDPDLLLLDEPTNHLDIESILWLEEFLAQSRFATLTITHDRVFLQRVSNRILELDKRNPGGLLSINGDYAAYLESKELLMSAQEVQEQKMKNTLRRETEWLRRGAKARQTKQQARIQKAEVLRQSVEELSERNVKADVNLEFVGAEKNPKRLIEATKFSKSYAGNVVVPELSLLITPKTRLGLLGPNGCGKSTLIKLLLKRENPDTGTVFHSDHLQVAYFEQNRESLDPELSLLRTVCPEGDFVDFAGNKVHVRSYLSRFLFNSLQVDMPVGKLSGGEQSRLLLARLMLTRANILVLDEPTNDLDMATLNVLEEMLKDFTGAVILVTHDRYFLDNVANKILAFGHNLDGEKIVVSFASLEQWENWQEEQKQQLLNQAESKTTTTDLKKERKKPNPQELEKLTLLIEQSEKKLADLCEQSQKPDVLADAAQLQEMTIKMAKIQEEINQLYARWGQISS